MRNKILCDLFSNYLLKTKCGGEPQEVAGRKVHIGVLSSPSSLSLQIHFYSTICRAAFAICIKCLYRLQIRVGIKSVGKKNSVESCQLSSKSLLTIEFFDKHSLSLPIYRLIYIFTD